jgi:hypothetical protein
MANKYLIQKRKGQRDHVYEWTEVLSEKPDMFPISVEDAEALLKQQREGHHRLSEAKPVEKNPIVEKPQERIDMNDVVNNEGDGEAPEEKEEYQEPTSVDEYNPAADPIIQKVYSLKTKNAVEGYALEMGFKLKRTARTSLTELQKQLSQQHIQRMTDILSDQG